MAIKLNFQNGGSRHLEFCRSEIWRQGNLRLARTYLRTKFGEDILNGARVMTIYVFLKWRPAAILDFQRSEIWRCFCFEDIGFSFWAKFYVNMCNRAWGMAIKVNFENGGSRHLEFCRSEIWCQGKSRLARIYFHTKFGEDILKGGRVMTIYMAAGRHLGFSDKWNLKVFLFPGRRFFSLSQILCKYVQ